MQNQKKAGGFSNNKKAEETKPKKQKVAPNVQEALEKMEAAEIKVIHGANDGTFNLSGATIAQVRASLVDAFNIPADALAFVNGEQVDNEFVLKAQDTCEFVRAAGVKGF
jgi:hypothetical protein